MVGIPRWIRRFRSDERGSATIEFVLWVPALVGLLVLVADATFLMNRQTLMYNSARDAARAVAIGARSTLEARADLLDRLGAERGYQVSVNSDGTFVTAQVSVPFAKVAMLGNLMGRGTLHGQAVMLIESGE